MQVLEAKTINWRAYHEYLEENVPIVDVLNLLGVNTRHVQGRDGKVLCPVHNESMPSMHVYHSTNSVHCFGCGNSWGPVGLYAAVIGIDYRDASDELAKRYGVSPDRFEGVTLQATADPQPYVQKKPEPKKLPESITHRWLEMFVRQARLRDLKRFNEWKIESWMVDLAGLGHTMYGDLPCGYAIPVWGTEIGKDLITIRFRRDDDFLSDRGILLAPELRPALRREEGFLRSISKKTGVSEEAILFANETKYWGLKGRNALYPHGLWSLGIDMSGDWLILTEGERTVYSLACQGVPIATLTGGVSGHAKPDGWPSWDYLLSKYKRWIIAFDDDEAGRKATEEMLELYPDKALAWEWPQTWTGLDLMDFYDLYGFSAIARTITELIHGGNERWEINLNNPFFRAMTN
jgi:hypothetical protein